MSDNLYRELEKYGDSDYYPYHMPGHKRRTPVFWEEEYRILHELYRIDITEIDGFDNLHHADGILRNVQQDAALLYGADETYFLVNGSTCGILSAVACAADRGKRIIMARNCHKSVYHAAFLQGLTVSYLYPEAIDAYGIAGAIRPEEVEKALKSLPDTAAVIITSPTYEGIVSDIRKIADITHRYGLPLIVDEAHGAHFGFHPAYPENAVRQGADIVIHSVHKMLPAMTQTALLHVSGSRVDKEKLQRYLAIYQTSSPSYVLMASIDACMKLMGEEGERLLERLWEYRAGLEKRSDTFTHIRIFGRREQGEYALTADPGKAVISVKNTDISGERLYRMLREKYHLQMELAADTYVLAMFTVMDDKEGFTRLEEALYEIDRLCTPISSEDKIHRQENCIGCQAWQPEIAVTLTEALEGEAEWIPLQVSIGRVSAGFINLYPPGIPFTAPGERVEEHTVETVRRCLDRKLQVQGVRDGYIKVLV